MTQPSLETLIEFAPIGSDNLVLLANIIANELNTLIDSGPGTVVYDDESRYNIEIEPDPEYVAGLHVVFETITTRLVVLNPDEPDFLSNNVVCPID